MGGTADHAAHQQSPPRRTGLRDRRDTALFHFPTATVMVPVDAPKLATVDDSPGLQPVAEGDAP